MRIKPNDSETIEQFLAAKRTAAAAAAAARKTAPKKIRDYSLDRPVDSDYAQQCRRESDDARRSAYSSLTGDNIFHQW